MRLNIKPCAAWPREGGRYAVSRLRRTVTMNITVEDCKRFNIATKCEKLKIVKGPGELMRRKT